MADKILMARFALNMDTLADMRVAVMEFPYELALDTFMADMIAINPKRDKIEYDEQHPIRRLNDVLIGTAPVLVHGFEEYGGSRKWEQSSIWNKPRRMLSLATDARHQPVWRPDTEQINDLAAVWATNWALTTFQQEIALRGGEEALEKLDEQIRSTQTHWQEADLLELWEQRDANKVVWTALPSVMAAIFVNRMQDQAFKLGDDSIQQDIHWRLTQDDNRQLAIVSAPIYYESGSKRDLISYKLEFTLQAQAGWQAPWIAVYVRMRRWADRAVSQTNFLRDTTVMVTLGSERKSGWHTEPTMIRLRVQGGVGQLTWQNDTPQLLSEWNARSLAEPNAVFADPQRFAQPDEHGDTYHILHAEGMRYAKPGKHRAKLSTPS